MTKLRFLLIALTLASGLLVGCRESQQSDSDETNSDIEITLGFEPDPPTTGESTLIVTLTDAEGNPIEDAQVDVRGDMDHAGMVPELTDGSDNSDGVYRLPFTWTMAVRSSACSTWSTSAVTCPWIWVMRTRWTWTTKTVNPWIWTMVVVCP